MLAKFLTDTAAVFKQLGIAHPRREAETILSYVLDMSPHTLYMHYERVLSEEELIYVSQAIERRAKREPTAYIMGRVMFADVQLELSPAVLIPRPETEILVEKIATTLAKEGTRNKVLWDVCSGSGCIGIALKKRFPDLTVFLSDLSKEALAIAKKNALLNCVQVHYKEGDLLQPFAQQTCDFFVCNPPYVSKEQWAKLLPEVREFEPRMALIADSGGLAFYERLARELKPHVGADARGWLELGARQGSNVKSIFEKEGWHCSFEVDWSGHDRFFYFQKL